MNESARTPNITDPNWSKCARFNAIRLDSGKDHSVLQKSCASFIDMKGLFGGKPPHLFTNAHRRFRSGRPEASSGARPWQGEVFTLEKLREHGRSFAVRHQKPDAKPFASLLVRLDDNEELLRHHCKTVKDEEGGMPASEWLLDNFYLILEQTQLARKHLPPGFNRELPRGPNGYPRVYDIALELISHVDAEVEADSLAIFLSAYQSVVPLKIGELWAVPIMLRLGLLEQLGQTAQKLHWARQDRELAARWIDKLEKVAEESPSRLVIVMGEMAQSQVPLSAAFVSEFSLALTRIGPALNWARNWFEQYLAEQGLSVEPLMHEENQNQAALQVSVSHCINSFRFLGSMDWKEFVETMSVVDHTLRMDPAVVYGNMDFQTRDCYRHVVENVAKHGRRSEPDVATMVLGMANQALGKFGPADRRAHVGYFLLGKGLPDLEKEAGVRRPWRRWLEHRLHSMPLAFYAGFITTLTLGTTLFMLAVLFSHQVPAWVLSLLFLPLFICASQFATGLVNWLTTFLVPPQLIPRMNYREGIPGDARTMVVVPSMLTSQGTIQNLLEMLELHYLGNNDPFISFALLTDFSDGADQVLPGDKELVDSACKGIAMLNLKYGDASTPPFYLFHRPRLWNPAEAVWMGEERKRGKLSQFNRLMRGDAKGCFDRIIGDPSIFASIKYVITLDADTQLPRESARKLVGAMMHPLNHPLIDEARGLVIDGYAILQPHVQVSLPSANSTQFVKLRAGEVGIDPYTKSFSDVYQDLFDQGSFIGKGIYDLDVFEKCTETRFPPNRILSHDLIESGYARSGLFSEVILYEDHPAKYQVDLLRRHRWVRGDWQLLPWLRSTVPNASSGCEKNVLPRLAQWKLLDNLRRSLVQVSALILLLLVWFLAPQAGLITLGFIAGMMLIPSFMGWTFALLRKPSELPLFLHLREMRIKKTRLLTERLYDFAFIPHEAFMHLDAIARTLWRLTVSKRRLLEWQTARDTERMVRGSLWSTFVTMWASVAVAALALTGWWFLYPQTLSPLVPLLLWLCSPLISWWISRPIVPPASELNPHQTAFLRRCSRKTWRFFETFVNDTENWLPPDNFQEKPAPVIAARTSPTNIGLCLLANLSAYDFGYIPLNEVLQRTRLTLASMQKMVKHRGHLYNWYDTRTLQPMRPHYISSVDSGNLAGHLLTMEPGLLNLADAPIFLSAAWGGLGDVIEILLELGYKPKALLDLNQTLRMQPGTLAAVHSTLQEAFKISSILEAGDAEPNDEIRWWVAALQNDLKKQLDALTFMAPWLLVWQETDSQFFKEGFTDADNIWETIPTFRQLSLLGQSVASTIRENLTQKDEKLAALFSLASQRAGHCILEMESLARECRELALMDFSFLFNQKRKLFSIGYNLDDCRQDNSCYDLLASEARLCSYVAIALEQVHQDHWFSLGRTLLPSVTSPVLASWSGSMFEYLMPMLVMPTYEGTLLSQTCHGAVDRQIEYGNAQGIPWGISESGYYRVDPSMNYQYQAFGVPGLGLKRGLAEDLVIAPYATAMALMVYPLKACLNLERLYKEGKSGPYGFYEAVDYTSARLPRGRTEEVIHSFMAHHQGMTFLALDYALLGQPMQRRFMDSPALKATVLLLQERVPVTTAEVIEEQETTRSPAVKIAEAMRIYGSHRLPSPEVHLMSNGRYHTMVSHAGGGYSRWKDIALTRWRPDSTQDGWGNFVYVRDIDSGEVWSASHQPVCREEAKCEAIFSQGRAEFRQLHQEIEVHTEICVSQEDDVEIRRLTLVNRSSRPRSIELTTYAEVVLTSAQADAAHPAFSNLFVQTEYDPIQRAILCCRRARSRDEKPPWLFHMVVTEGQVLGEVSCETDRNRFIGRGRDLKKPAALDKQSKVLSGSVGPVLDPIIALRCTVLVGAHENTRLDFLLGIAGTREGAETLIQKFSHPRMSDRGLELAWTHSHVTLRALNITETDAQLFARLAGHIIYPNPALRAPSTVLLSNRRNQSGLWSQGLSGDIPIILLRIYESTRVTLLKRIVQAQSYWRAKGLVVDLVVVSHDVHGYRQPLQDEILRLMNAGGEGDLMEKPGGVFLRYEDQLSADDLQLIQAAAHVVLSDENGTLEEQMERPSIPDSQVPMLKPGQPARKDRADLPWRDLECHNGFGGFTKDGKEYVITLHPGQNTPAPWINVLANPYFGTIISESGASYTWLENCHEFRITPWSNDPVRDPSGEAIYIRDEETGQFWSPTPHPARGTAPYVVRHGFGYTVFESTENGISTELWIYVATDAPVKFALLKVRNNGGTPRSLSVTGYWEWVLAELRSKSLLHIQTQLDPRSGALLARNPYNNEFGERIAFVDANRPSISFTADRKEFIGRNGTLSSPQAMRKQRLSGKVGAGFDSCAALQVPLEIPAHGEHEICFRFGVGRGNSEVQTLIQRFRRPNAARDALSNVWNSWNASLGTVTVETPEPAVNFMANGWLQYQTQACRMWARSGFYQSGGAFGFRDQLQDSMAMVHAEPGLLREQILRAAAQQFREGDVQHWWHPPGGRGVRTHFSDDYLWLPYAVCRYISCLADTGVLDERIPFLEGRLLAPEEESNYDLPARSVETGSLYEHCVRAIQYGLKFGVHGLPLIGCGDWNDGMNRIGEQGKGESVWLAFFLYDVLIKFSDLARLKNDPAFEEICMQQAAQLKKNIVANAWDGEWYRRAYFDDGTPLGSKSNPECQIDALPQSWSILSGAGDPERSKQAMAAVAKRLIREDARLIQLFDPPFDTSDLDPGYIKGYIPGVRENGGQYTHSAIWTAMAFAEMGEHERAWELFRMLNPVNHGDNAERVAIYKVEPYVVAADVYAVEPHVGRGGWTWYTGSAGWMYRFLLETLLGLHREGDALRLHPRLPRAWPGIKIHYRFRSTLYHISISQGSHAGEGDSLVLDGQKLEGDAFPLKDDLRDHHVSFVLGFR